MRTLQPGQVLHTGTGRASVLYVAPIAPEARIVHLVLGRIDGHVTPAERIHVAHWPADARVQVEQGVAVEWLLDVRATCILINNPPTIERKHP